MPTRVTRGRATGDPAPERGFTRRDLHAIAEVAYHYLRCGGFELGRTLFEGLAAIDPREPYFALALGLAADHLGDRADAVRWYERARTLDPLDGRPDINLAELALAEGDSARASALLRTGTEKARARKDVVLERKARALLEIILGSVGSRRERVISGVSRAPRIMAASLAREIFPRSGRKDRDDPCRR